MVAMTKPLWSLIPILERIFCFGKIEIGSIPHWRNRLTMVRYAFFPLAATFAEFSLILSFTILPISL
jgi:hypothetical protein